MPKKEKSDLQNQQAGIDITMVEKYLDEVAAQTLDIADKKTLFDLFVRKIEVKQGNLSVDFKIKIYSTMVALTGIVLNPLFLLLYKPLCCTQYVIMYKASAQFIL